MICMWENEKAKAALGMGRFCQQHYWNNIGGQNQRANLSKLYLIITVGILKMKYSNI